MKRLGSMMCTPLHNNSIPPNARENRGIQQIFTARDDGELHAYSCRELEEILKESAVCTMRHGVRSAHDMATFAWSICIYREIYYATAGISAICHAINPHLCRKQLGFIINDAHFAELVKFLRPRCPLVGHWVPLSEGAGQRWAVEEDYGDWLGKDTRGFESPVFDECGRLYAHH